MKKQCGFCECSLEMNEIVEATEEGLCDHCYENWANDDYNIGYRKGE